MTAPREPRRSPAPRRTTPPGRGAAPKKTAKGSAARNPTAKNSAKPQRTGRATPQRAGNAAPARKPAPREPSRGRESGRPPSGRRKPAPRKKPATASRLGLQAPPDARRKTSASTRGAAGARRPAPLEGRRYTPARPAPGRPEIRQRWLIGATAVIVLVFVARLVQVQVIQGPELAADAQAARLATAVTPAHRGDITDADGVVLATSVDRYTVVADPVAIQDFRGHGRVDSRGEPVQDGALGVAQLLGPVLSIPDAELAAKLVGDTRYVVLAKDVVPRAQRAIAELGLRAYIRTDLVSKRTYPAGTVGAGLLGFVDGEQAGRAGIEAAYDDVLAGSPGSETYERSRDGLRIPAADQEYTPAVPGDDVRLTLVHDVQWKAQDAVDQAVRDTGAAYGIAVVQDVRTGEVVALADSDAPDPNDRSTAAVAEPSKAVTAVFEPGSTGKVVTMAAALETGVWKPGSRFTVPYRWTAPSGQTFTDSHEHAVERLTLTGVLAKSSNVGTVMVGEKIPLQTRQDYLTKFGFGQPTGLGLPGESVGLMPPDDVEQWDLRTRDTVLFGQALAVNAIQATSVFTTVANGGIRTQPTLLAGTTDDDGTETPAQRPDGERVISTDTADTLLHMMEAVTDDDGTAANAKVPGYRVAGKTGTAQMWLENGQQTYMASFVGVAPADDPRYTVGVFLRSPQSSIYGGEVAAPVFSDVMGFTLQKMDVPPSDEKYRPLRTTW
ncbi:peptidoglycan D,D-transpeptidase FtsI family protein [Myceligenerans pegani]|uniref:Penicillin-binding protein 2 n=1 Tax=Myceligenerans pegani TaxID=2776917 RepID=A0ABR9MZC5_9MICO|nr:penicillin-binding protein 2 [Myceligenerans sp. TRM 65318]MBE1876445.1 penicillin-binding protein 2 [Myceligenerans sp. TRM 65318]MBE3018716.1 penicillin-binding protein 2 [Myceligenerans sp. TRM 65318]